MITCIIRYKILEKQNENEEVKEENDKPNISLPIFIFTMKEFLSVPLTVHTSIFSISISFDTIIWGLIDKFLFEHKKKKNKEKFEKIAELLKDAKIVE